MLVTTSTRTLTTFTESYLILCVGRCWLHITQNNGKIILKYLSMCKYIMKSLIFFLVYLYVLTSILCKGKKYVAMHHHGSEFYLSDI